MLQEVERDGIALEGVGEFEVALQAMNHASHGLDVDPDAAEHAIEVGTQLLETLKRLNGYRPLGGSET
jgi:ribosomal protein S16